MNTLPGISTRHLLNKVPEVTVLFWIIKMMSTTVGETAADFLNGSLNFGLTATTIVVGALFAIALLFQIRAKHHVPSPYWITVVFISVFGTLITDNLSDNLGVPLAVSTGLFNAALATTFAVWYARHNGCQLPSRVNKLKDLPSLQTWVMLQRRNSLQLRATTKETGHEKIYHICWS